MTLYIKNMVCDRCIMAVKFELIKIGIVPIYVSLGEVELESELTELQYQQLMSIFQLYGFEILDENNTQIIKKIKDVIVEFVNTSDNKINYSEEIEKKTEIKYTYSSNLFSEVTGMAIEQFITAQKIEKVKGLLEYNDFTLTEVSKAMGFRSVTYLSSQFKKVTGFTPHYFKKIKNKKRKLLATAIAHQEYDISIIDKCNTRAIAKIKNVVIELVHNLNETKKINFSEFIAKKLKLEYNYLNKLFSEIEEVTIEQYIILQKIEKAKELIVYKNNDLNKISKILGYNSITDLSKQLKIVTGLTASYFEYIRDRKALLQNAFKSINDIKRIKKSIRIKTY